MTDLFSLILSVLKEYYRIEVETLNLLPAGADINASVYKAQGKEQRAYFVKLRYDHSQDTNIEILELLRNAGVHQIIAPLKTVEGNISYQTDIFTLIVYPFIEGQDGFTCALSDEQWIALGQALRQIYDINIPISLQTRLHQENFSSRYRDIVRSFYIYPEAMSLDDEISMDLWKFLQKEKVLIQRIVDRAEHLSQKIRDRSLKLVLCHTDLHGGNILIHDQSAFYIVDWDSPLLAPKERDLMFIGGGVGNVWNKPYEQKLFYQGYGQTSIDDSILAYYRYERIVVDIA